MAKRKHLGKCHGEKQNNLLSDIQVFNAYGNDFVIATSENMLL
jgi:hypothetical protein